MKTITFAFSIGGYPGPYFHLQLEGDRLVCTHVQDLESSPQVTSLSFAENPAWETLMAYLNTRRWKGYYAMGAMDGTQWELSASGDNWQIYASGENKYPPGFKTFLRLLNIVTAASGIEIY